MKQPRSGFHFSSNNILFSKHLTPLFKTFSTSFGLSNSNRKLLANNFLMLNSPCKFHWCFPHLLREAVLKRNSSPFFHFPTRHRFSCSSLEFQSHPPVSNHKASHLLPSFFLTTFTKSPYSPGFRPFFFSTPTTNPFKVVFFASEEKVTSKNLNFSASKTQPFINPWPLGNTRQNFFVSNSRT